MTFQKYYQSVRIKLKNSMSDVYKEALVIPKYKHINNCQ